MSAAALKHNTEVTVKAKLKKQQGRGREAPRLGRITHLIKGLGGHSPTTQAHDPREADSTSPARAVLPKAQESQVGV